MLKFPELVCICCCNIKAAAALFSDEAEGLGGAGAFEVMVESFCGGVSAKTNKERLVSTHRST